jgi:hypothetical protein
MPWRIVPERVVPAAARELEALFGPDLRTLVLYGSACRADFRPEYSDVNFAVVAEPLEFGHLQRIAQWWVRWRRKRVAAPLVLSCTDLTRSCDVFPLELLDIQANHRTLRGAELFQDLAFPAAAVCAECEREAKGKLVRLRELYLEVAGSTLEVRALMVDSRKSFYAVMRGLLYARGETWISEERAVVEAFERRHGRRFPVLATLAAATPDQPLDQAFAQYLEEVEALAAIADRAGERDR